MEKDNNNISAQSFTSSFFPLPNTYESNIFITNICDLRPTSLILVA